MPSFPTIGSGVICKYPVARSHKHRTAVHVFIDLSEQRYAKGSPLEEFELGFRNVNTTDKNTVRAFFVARRGELDTTWDFTFEAVLFQHLQFAQARFDAVEDGHGLWSFTLKIRQTRKN